MPIVVHSAKRERKYNGSTFRCIDTTRQIVWPPMCRSVSSAVGACAYSEDQDQSAHLRRLIGALALPIHSQLIL